MIKSIFYNNDKELRPIIWVVLFFIGIASLLFPLILLADRYSFEITMFHQALLLLMVSVLFQIFRRKSISELTGKFNLTGLKEFIYGLIIGALLMILPAVLFTLFGLVKWNANEFNSSILFDGITLFIAVAIAEELLFRGFIFQRLLESFGKWPAQLLMAALFLLTHINNPGMNGIVKILASINIFIASILFGIAYLKTKSLLMPIGLHFMANFMQGTLLGFGVSGNKESSVLKPIFNDVPVWLSGGEFGIEASFFGLVILIGISIYVYKNNRITSVPF